MKQLFILSVVISVILLASTAIIAAPVPCSGAYGKTFADATYGQKVWLCTPPDFWTSPQKQTWVAPTIAVYNEFTNAISAGDKLGISQAVFQGYFVNNGTLALHLGYASGLFDTRGDMEPIKVRLYSGPHIGEIVFVAARWVQPAEPRPQ